MAVGGGGYDFKNREEERSATSSSQPPAAPAAATSSNQLPAAPAAATTSNQPPAATEATEAAEAAKAESSSTTTTTTSAARFDAHGLGVLPRPRSTAGSRSLPFQTLSSRQNLHSGADQISRRTTGKAARTKTISGRVTWPRKRLTPSASNAPPRHPSSVPRARRPRTSTALPLRTQPPKCTRLSR